VSNVGRKLLLHTNSSPQHATKEPDTFIAIEIIEERPVPGAWSGKSDTHTTGWKARGDDGHFWYVNWDHFDDLSMTPAWRWHSPEQDKSAYDIEQGLYVEIPQRPKFLDKYEFMGYCEDHKKLYNKSSDHIEGMCFDCWLDKKFPEKRKAERAERDRERALAPKPWNGWF